MGEAVLQVGSVPVEQLVAEPLVGTVVGPFPRSFRVLVELSRDIGFNGRVDGLNRPCSRLVVLARHLVDRFRPPVDGYFAGGSHMVLGCFRLFFMLADEEG